ncbi:MAG TPA: hypothetical protein VF486_00170 [Actinomycetes bacterium]
MRSKHRALAMLALGLALVGSTTAAAFATPAPPVKSSDALAQRKALYQSELALNLQHQVAAPATIKASDELAQRKALYQSELGANLQRNVRPDHPVVFAPIIARPAATATGVNVLATVLLGLAAGLVGGAALVAGWAAATRRRPHRTAAAT